MNLSELKQKPIGELLEMTESLGLDNLARSRKQDIIFALLKKHAKSGEDIYGDGVLEILPDGFGFLRSAGASYLAGPDDIYVSPSQIRRFNLRTGDTVSGQIRQPKETERYFALLKVEAINFEDPEIAREKILFDNLTPLYPETKMNIETVREQQRIAIVKFALNTAKNLWLRHVRHQHTDDLCLLCRLNNRHHFKTVFGSILGGRTAGTCADDDVVTGVT